MTISPELSKQLRVSASAMGFGVFVMLAVVFFLHLRAASTLPNASAIKIVHVLTLVAMSFSVVGIFISEIIWKKMLAGLTPQNVNNKIKSAFLVRSALREGTALLGAAALLPAAIGGLLNSHPVYWVNTVPALLFWMYLYLHWPSENNLNSEIELYNSSVKTL